MSFWDEQKNRSDRLRKRYGSKFIVPFFWTFASNYSEAKYCKNLLRKDKKLFKFWLFLIFVSALAIVPVDINTARSEAWTLVVVANRVCFALFCLLCYSRVNRIYRFKEFQRLFTIWSILLFASLLVGQIGCKPDYILTVVYDIGLILLFFLSIFIPAIIQACIGIAYVICVFILVLGFKQVDGFTTYTILFAYTCIIFISLVLSGRMHLYQRHQYRMAEELKARANRLQKFAYRDALTGVYNRRAFTEHFEKYQRAAIRAEVDSKGVYVVLADLDYFKRINDNFGHGVGDLVLVGVAKLINSMIRPMDGFYRFGGEEFIIVFPEVKSLDARMSVERIVSALNEQEYGVAGLGVVTCSFGMAKLHSSDHPELPLSKADKALYQAKENGRNQLVVSVD